MQHYTLTGNEGEGEEEMDKPFHQFVDTQTANNIHFYISEAVGLPNDYVEMIHKIRNATPNDTIFIHLNTPGGVISTGVQMVNAMQSTEARVVTVLESEACSLGTILFLAGDEFIVHDNCRMMFHNYSGGAVGKGQEIEAQVESTGKWFNELLRKFCTPFLSEEEVERIIRGEDLWVHSDEIRERLDRMIEEMNKQNEEEQEEQEVGKKPNKNNKKTKKYDK